jgi:hypothetical protein
MTNNTQFALPMRVTLAHGSKAEKGFRRRATIPEPEVLAPGLHPTPAHNLLFHGGNLLPDLEFFNFFVGGAAAWQQADIQAIDQGLEKAMTDQHLNNVMSQYFRGGRITTVFKGSRILAGPKPAVVTQGDVEGLVIRLFRDGTLNGFDLSKTVFDFMLPSGTLLNTDEAPTAGALSSHVESAAQAKAPPNAAIPHEEEDSTQGLGGYHGSVHVGSGAAQNTIYYAIGVFSELLPNGTTNGIVAFNQPFKNVIATFYHELNEARTDPDVEDAIRAGNSPNAVKFLGWTSKQGEECGDFPVFEANPLSQVFKEVPLTSGPGTIPVQFQYSNAVKGPEGPIPTPDPPLLR